MDVFAIVNHKSSKNKLEGKNFTESNVIIEINAGVYRAVIKQFPCNSIAFNLSYSRWILDS